MNRIFIETTKFDTCCQVRVHRWGNYRWRNNCCPRLCSKVYPSDFDLFAHSTIIDVGLQNKNITILFKRICMTLYHLSPNQSCHFDEVTHSDECHAWSALISFLPWKHLRTHLDHEWECEREKCEWLRNRSQRTAIAKENTNSFGTFYILNCDPNVSKLKNPLKSRSRMTKDKIREAYVS